MKEVAAAEAKQTLNSLLDLVAQGEEVIITRDGREAARLVPPPGAAGRQSAREAAAAIRAMSKGVTLGGISIKDLVNKGRR